jgi:hypothetical protein
VEVSLSLDQLLLDDVSAAVIDLGSYETRAGKFNMINILLRV